MMRDPEEAAGMISVAQEIQMICAGKFYEYIPRTMALIQYRREIYFQKEQPERDRKFL